MGGKNSSFFLAVLLVGTAVLSALAAPAAAEFGVIVGDQKVIRSITQDSNNDWSLSTVTTTTKATVQPVPLPFGYVGVTPHTNGKLYAVDPAGRAGPEVWSFSAKSSGGVVSYAGSLLAGGYVAPAPDVSPDRRCAPDVADASRCRPLGVFVDGTGAAASFRAPPIGLDFFSNGTLVYMSSAIPVVLRRVTVAGVVESLPQGKLAVGTIVSALVVNRAVDDVYFAVTTAIYKLDALGKRTIVVGQAPAGRAAVTGVDGQFASATVVGVTGLTIGAPTSSSVSLTLFMTDVGSVAPARDLHARAVYPTTTLKTAIRKLDILVSGDITLTTVGGNMPGMAAADSVGASRDGVGSSARIGRGTGIAFNPNLGQYFVTEVCEKGSVLRAFTMSSSGLADVTTVVGDLAALQCRTGDKIDASMVIPEPVDSEAGVTLAAGSVLVVPGGIKASQELCGYVFLPDVTVDLSSLNCNEDFGGGLQSLKTQKNGKLVINKPLKIKKVLEIVNSIMEINSRVEVGESTMVGSGALLLVGADVTTPTMMMDPMAVIGFGVGNTKSSKITVSTQAQLDGTVVIRVASSDNFGLGDSHTILQYSEKLGGFVTIHFVKLRTRRRAMQPLQAQATNAAVNCGATSCVATGITLSGDDDDEVPIIVALAVVSVVLVLAVVGFVIVAVRRKAQKAEAAALSPSSSSSSSSSYNSSLLYGAPDFGIDSYTSSYSV